MVIEELGKGDLGVSVIFAQTLKIAQIMQKALNEEQKDRVLPAFAADPRGMLAIGITEPDNASNYFLPHPTPFRTFAEEVDGGFIINGMKHFISNGNRASFYLLFVADRERQAAVAGLDLLSSGARPRRFHHRQGARQDGRALGQQRRACVPELLCPGRECGGRASARVSICLRGSLRRVTPMPRRAYWRRRRAA
jgi:alkylation response protein AidB-like acyl-CoA dehydrogenase